jgi:RimJ/RimL family protein N-acetyltransferase
MSLTPVIETARLILRGHTYADLDASAAMWADPGVARYIGGKPSTREESWARMLRFPGHWALRGYGYWLVEEKSSGLFVGEAGFGDFKRTMNPDFGGAPEQGWAFAPTAHGKGYATEAGLAGIDWARAHFGAIDVFCMIAPQNDASLRVADKLGYREYTRAERNGDLSILLRRRL